MKYFTFLFTLLLFSVFTLKTFAQTIPQHDHVVICVLENHSSSGIVGSFFAPYINSLIGGTHTAHFTESYGLTHPSQPNYLMLYSGTNQGVTDDADPGTWPFTTPNLGAQLLDGGYSFIGYSEDLPDVGSNVSTSGDYARKHNPWVNWQDASTNGVPAISNQPFTSFPSDFSTLPTLSFVIPNLAHDMHDPIILPTAISNGDTWVQDFLDSYIQWAKTNNSLFILTFDEDDQLSSNHILTLFIGENVIAGDYSEHIDHYDILRTLEDMYGLPYAANASLATPITDCWVQTTIGINEAENNTENMLYPNPASSTVTMDVNSDLDESAHVTISNVLSQTVAAFDKQLTRGNNKFTLQVDKLENGTYFVTIKSSQKSVVKKLTVKN